MQLFYEITPTDHLEMVKAVRSGSVTRILTICLGVVGLVAAVLMVDESWGAALVLPCLVIIILGIFLPYLVHRRVYHRNPRLYGMRTVTFDEHGLKSDSEIAHVEIKWTSFEKFEETKNLFLTFQTRDIVGIVPKRAFGNPATVEQFRELLTSKVRRH